MKKEAKQEEENALWVTRSLFLNETMKVPPSEMPPCPEAYCVLCMLINWLAISDLSGKYLDAQHLMELAVISFIYSHSLTHSFTQSCLAG